MRRSVDLARAARAEMSGDGRTRWAAASVGPYGAALADGSEYRGRYGLSVRELAAWHRPRLEVLAGSGPDVLALETVPDIDEAEAMMAAISGLGIPAWLSYSIAGERTRAGQPLSEAFAVAAGVPEVVAVGVNCCAPADVPMAIAAAREVTGKPVIVYPNSGEEWDARRRAWAGRSRYSAGQPRQWIAAGANVVGGCCRVRPADIAVIAQAAASAGQAPPAEARVTGTPRCVPVAIPFNYATRGWAASTHPAPESGRRRYGLDDDGMEVVPGDRAGDMPRQGCDIAYPLAQPSEYSPGEWPPRQTVTAFTVPVLVRDASCAQGGRSRAGASGGGVAHVVLTRPTGVPRS